jgi:DNA-binding MarR family transcriptional regulator
MAKNNVTVRAERIIRLLPKIMGSIGHWRHEGRVAGSSERAQSSRPNTAAKTPGVKEATLTFNQFQTLVTIRELGECSVNDLSAKLRIAQSTTSQLIDRLVHIGVVTSEAFAGDRRRMVVKLSKTGVQMLERRRKSLVQSYTRILLMLDESDQEMLEDAFEKFYHIAATLERLRSRNRG